MHTHGAGTLDHWDPSRSTIVNNAEKTAKTLTSSTV